MDAKRLRSIPLFGSLGDNELEQVARYADEVDVPEGKELAREGEFAYEFFVIEDGHAEVLEDGQRVRELGPQDFFGEIGLLETERRTATVVARSDMELIVIFGPNFRRLERELPDVAAKVRAAISERLGG